MQSCDASGFFGGCFRSKTHEEQAVRPLGARDRADQYPLRAQHLQPILHTQIASSKGLGIPQPTTTPVKPAQNKTYIAPHATHAARLVSQYLVHAAAANAASTTILLDFAARQWGDRQMFTSIKRSLFAIVLQKAKRRGLVRWLRKGGGKWTRVC